MSQKELLEAISRKAGLKTDQILAEATERAAGIVRRAEGEVGKIKQGILDQARASMSGEEAKIVNDARLKAKREFLHAKYELISSAMKSLDHALAELPKRKDYPAILGRLLDEGLKGVTGQVLIRCRPADRKLVEAYLAQHKVQATMEDAPFPLGGIEVRHGDSFQFIRKNTFQSRLEKIYPQLLQEANLGILGAQESR
jgi:vacuolar-type H+-ATPase subunit E/Vma4